MYNDKNYLFSNIIDDVCRGEWPKRVEAYEKYFGTAPTGLKGNISKLDELRRTRNEIGHYFGRKKNQYETHILMDPKEVERVSHENLIKYTFATDVYLYSSKVIDLIVTEVAKDPTGIIDALIEKHKRISSTTT